MAHFRNAVEILADGNDLTFKPAAIYVGGGGDLHVELTKSTTDVTFKNVQPGTVLEIEVKKVFADSTASELLGLN